MQVSSPGLAVRFKSVLIFQRSEMDADLSSRQADPIWPEDEEKLWQKGVFGKENSEQLQHTMFFYSCKLFGLRACDEHHKLLCE